MPIKAILAGAAVLAFILGAAWLYNHGKKVEAMEGTVSGQNFAIEKGTQNADVLVNRPDYDGYINSLRAGAY